jgi:hypothetical protein
MVAHTAYVTWDQRDAIRSKPSTQRRKDAEEEHEADNPRVLFVR